MGCLNLNYYREQAPFFVKVEKPDKEGSKECMQGWLSVDPMAGKRSWVSPYSYCQDNPLNRVDPTGELDWIPPTDGSGKWTAESGDNAWTLHKDAGISYDRAKSLMKSQGFKFSNNDTRVDVKTGDVVDIWNGYTWNTSTPSSPTTTSLRAPSTGQSAPENSVDINQVAKTTSPVAGVTGLATDATRQIVQNPNVGYSIAYNSTLLKGVSYLKPISYLATGLGLMSDITLSLNNEQSWTETGLNTTVTGVSLAVGGLPGLVIQGNYMTGKAYMKAIIKHPGWAPYPIHGR